MLINIAMICIHVDYMWRLLTLIPRLTDWSVTREMSPQTDDVLLRYAAVDYFVYI